MTDQRTGAITPTEHLRPVATPGRMGQATAVEQSRAVAEVQAAVLVAQQCPRDPEWAKAEMRRACSEFELAKKAFYRYNRGGGNVSGPSVSLARELARCWGNIDYGIAELRRDDDHAQSEMKAWAWDQQTNARSSNTFIVPHMRDKKGGPERLTDLRDIYENNANMGARRAREAIFAVLPVWLVEEAKNLCTETLERGDGRPLEERIQKAVVLFGGMGVTLDQIERRLDRPRSQWNAADLAELTVVAQSIRQREVSVADEFPPVRVTADEIAAASAPAPVPADVPPAPPVESPPAADETPTDPAPADEVGPISAPELIAAGIAAGRIDKKSGHGAQLKTLTALCAELTGATVADVQRILADQALAEELLAKLLALVPPTLDGSQ